MLQGKKNIYVLVLSSPNLGDISWLQAQRNAQPSAPQGAVQDSHQGASLFISITPDTDLAQDPASGAREEGEHEI